MIHSLAVTSKTVASLDNDFEEVTGQKGFGEWAVRKGYLVIKEEPCQNRKEAPRIPTTAKEEETGAPILSSYP